MEKYIFVFASLTTANRVKFYLKSKSGMSFNIEKVSKTGVTPGCSYGLIVPADEKNEVEKTVRSLDANLIGIFKEKELRGGI